MGSKERWHVYAVEGLRYLKIDSDQEPTEQFLRWVPEGRSVRFVGAYDHQPSDQELDAQTNASLPLVDLLTHLSALADQIHVHTTAAAPGADETELRILFQDVNDRAVYMVGLINGYHARIDPNFEIPSLGKGGA